MNNWNKFAGIKKGLKYLLVFTLFTIGLKPVIVQAQQIKLIHADSVHYDEEKDRYIRMLMGNVKMSQGNATMSCKRANLDDQNNTFEAFGGVHIFQADTINLSGDHLIYDGDTKIAIMDGNVVMLDQDMRLTTDAITYNMDTRIGYYTTGGVLTSGSDKLTSQIGTYNGFSKMIGFRKDVVLTNPKYTMTGDTLIYSTVSKTAWFYGPTEIVSEENKILCNYGWYNTNSETSEFSKRATIFTGSNIISSDSMLYNRKTGVGRAFDNIEVIDTVERIKIRGHRGRYNEITKNTIVTVTPRAVKYFEKDSMLILADTFYYQSDTAVGKVLSAYRNTKLYKQDMQSSADSLTYSVDDSSMHLFYQPIVWTEANQITGVKISLFMVNNEIETMFVEENAFVLSEEGEQLYNQISGRNMESKFEDNEIKTVKVMGNGQSIYYAEEDSASYMGANKIACGEMLILMDSNKIQEINFYNKPEGTFYPLDKFPLSERKLRGFKLWDMLRPKESDFVFPKRD
jgi:lipopolysaccharide export system protein LptA